MGFKVAGHVKLTADGRATLELQTAPPEPGRAGPPGNRGTLAKPTVEQEKALIEDKAVVLHDSRRPLWSKDIQIQMSNIQKEVGLAKDAWNEEAWNRLKTWLGSAKEDGKERNAAT